MRITKRHLRKIIFETAPTFGLRTGDIVRHKDEEWRGTGKVVAKGSTRSRSISVIWSDGSRQRHDPSSLVKESKMRSAKKQTGKSITAFSTNASSLYRFMNEVSEWRRQRVFETIFGTPKRSRTSLTMVLENIDTIESIIFEGEEGEELTKDTKQVIKTVTKDQKVEVPAKNFVIMVGGPGTGKGGVINTDKFMGSTVDATGGVMASQGYLESEEGKDFGVQIQDEVDGFLRIEQRAHANEVHDKLNQTADSGDDAFKQYLETLIVTDNASVSLRDAIATALGKSTWEDITADVWKASELASSPDAMVGPEAGAKSLKGGGGVDGIKTQFMLLRSKWGEAAEAMSLKSKAVKNHGDALKSAIAKFVKDEVESDTKKAGDELPATRQKKGVYILDSAGEDLPTQDYEGQLSTAKSLGFKTYIVWLNTGPEVSYVGNLERSVTGGKRAVPAGEIAAYYDAAEGGMAGGQSAKDYFTSLTQQKYAPTEDDNPHAIDLGEVPLLDKVLVLNQKDELDASEVSDIATQTCVNPAGFDGKTAGDSAGAEHNIDNPLCDPETAKEISGMDDIDFSVEAGAGAPKNYGELKGSLKDEIINQVERAINGEEVSLPSSVTDVVGDLKGSIQAIADEYSKKDLESMDQDALKTAAADLGVDIDELSQKVAKQVQDDRQNAIRGLIKKGKGAEFETEEITAGRVRSNDDMILERWQKLAGIL
jgi:hypothetical protein